MDIISSQYTNKYDDFNDNKTDMNNYDNDIFPDLIIVFHINLNKNILMIIELDDGKFYRKALKLMVF